MSQRTLLPSRELLLPAMTIFPLISLVLDDLYERISADGDKDDCIRAEMCCLRNEYKQLVKKGCVDYSCVERQYAYVYMYTVAHASFVNTIVSSVSSLSEMMITGNQVTMSCVGGGPGSDFLGVMKYCLNKGMNPRLRAYVYDRIPTWGETWFDVNDRISESVDLRTSFLTLDVTEEDSWKSYTKLYESDLITLVYFVSEVYALRNRAESFFYNMLDRIRPGAQVLFLDNNASMFYEWFDEMVEQNSCEVLASNECDYRLPAAEEKRDLGLHFERFGDPKLSSKIAYRVVRKC
jgi:hypothetical protein